MSKEAAASNRIIDLFVDRAQKTRDLDQATDKLRRAVLAAIEAGELTEYKVSKITGLSRTTIRAWMGK